MGRRAYADGHEDVWEDESGHLGTLCGCLSSETLWRGCWDRARTSGRRRTWSGGEPEQPEGEGVDLVLGWPAVDGVFVEALADEGVDKVGEAGSIELAAVLAVVLQQHGEAGPEGVDEVIGMDVAAADGLEGAEVGAELGVEAERVEIAETTGGAGLVEGETKEVGVEMLVVPEAEGVVKVPRGEEEGEEHGRGRCGAVVEVEDDFLEELEGETEDGRHGERGGRGVKWPSDIYLAGLVRLRMITAAVHYGRSSNLLLIRGPAPDTPTHSPPRRSCGQDDLGWVNTEPVSSGCPQTPSKSPPLRPSHGPASGGTCPIFISLYAPCEPSQRCCSVSSVPCLLLVSGSRKHGDGPPTLIPGALDRQIGAALFVLSCLFSISAPVF